MKLENIICNRTERLIEENVCIPIPFLAISCNTIDLITQYECQDRLRSVLSETLPDEIDEAMYNGTAGIITLKNNKKINFA